MTPQEQAEQRRNFWERAYASALSAQSTDAVNAGVIADAALWEWDRRFAGTREAPAPPVQSAEHAEESPIRCAVCKGHRLVKSKRPGIVEYAQCRTCGEYGVEDMPPVQIAEKRSRGIYGKFRVSRVDGTDGPGMKHDGCKYFVLDAMHDPHAKAALIAYANSCASEYPLLAHDVRKMAESPAQSAELPQQKMADRPNHKSDNRQGWHYRNDMCSACGCVELREARLVPEPEKVRRMQANLDHWDVRHEIEHDESPDCKPGPQYGCQPVEQSKPEPKARRRQWIVEESQYVPSLCAVNIRPSDGELVGAHIVREIKPIDEARLEELQKLYGDTFAAYGYSPSGVRHALRAVLEAVGLTVAGGGK